MAKPIPLPVEMLIGHPDVVALPNAAYHAVIALALVYWHNECRYLPDADRDMIALARIDLRTMTTYRQYIRNAVYTLLPELAQHRAAEQVKLDARIRSARSAAAASVKARHAAAAAATDTPHHPPPGPPREPHWQPSRAARYSGTGQTDKAARDASRARHLGVQAQGTGGGLVDAPARGITGGSEGERRGLVDSVNLPTAEGDALPHLSPAMWDWQPGAPPPSAPDPLAKP